MAAESIAGFALHGLCLKDINTDTYYMWFACIPFVIFFAPLGAYVIDRISRNIYNYFLYLVFAIQYIGALIVIKPDLNLFIFSLFIIASGILIFVQVGRVRKHKI